MADCNFLPEEKMEITLWMILLVIILTEFINYPAGRQNQVCFKDYCFSVELAMTPEEREKGLMFRKNLDSDKGMLFIFDKEGKHGFWMKNTLIPLDIIWINNDREVVFINEKTQPCKENDCPIIKPTKDAKYVLEINEGLSEKNGLSVGNKVYIEF